MDARRAEQLGAMRAVAEAMVARCEQSALACEQLMRDAGVRLDRARFRPRGPGAAPAQKVGYLHK
jgi:hypothetical protein